MEESDGDAERFGGEEEGVAKEAEGGLSCASVPNGVVPPAPAIGGALPLTGERAGDTERGWLGRGRMGVGEDFERFEKFLDASLLGFSAMWVGTLPEPGVGTADEPSALGEDTGEMGGGEEFEP